MDERNAKPNKPNGKENPERDARVKGKRMKCRKRKKAKAKVESAKI